MNNSRHVIAVAMILAVSAISGCKKEQPETTPAVSASAPSPAPAVAEPAPAPAPPPSAEELAKAADSNSQALTANDTTWTPEALEELLAPIALYPDSVLEQLLVASTNPQEVLDAGNWLFDNKALKGKALDEAADEKGFTPPVLALVQFPETVDMLCQQMTWTTELGQAYVNDQAGVLDAIQRLRRQARDVGSLQTSPKMTVASEKINNVEYVTVASPSPETVYIPQYDPVAAYVPQPVTESSTTVVKQGHSTGALLLAFGAGILVNEIFDNDDDRYCRRYYYSYRCRGGSYWGRPPSYYPPYPYRPLYGNGFYPSYGYNRPGFNRPGFNNNDVDIDININNNNYWNRFDNNRWDKRQRIEARSPITAARPKREDLRDLNRMAAKGPKRIAPRTGPEFNDREQFKAARFGKDAKRDAGAIKGSYKGAKPGADRLDRVAAGKAAGQAAKRDLPKVQGSYRGGSRDKPMNGKLQANRDKPMQRPAIADKAKPAARPMPGTGANKRPNVDRGYGNEANRRDREDRRAPAGFDRPQVDRSNRPEQRPQIDRANRPAQQRPQVDRANRPEQQRPQMDRSNRQGNRMQDRSSRPSAVSGNRRNGNQERAASQRGKQSMPNGARARTQRRDNR